ncbi:Methyltransferase type 11 domain protein, partial [mine drainage metagenome]
MTAPPTPADTAEEAVSDYARFDFRALWRGRARVTEVERRILREALTRVRPDRTLEVGTGFGRLLPEIEAIAPEVVACDFDRDALAGLTGPAPTDSTRWRVAANVYHLPFRDGAFSAASMVRVYHHLEAPARALGELRRVLAPKGRLFLSYVPRPSIGTLVHDVRWAIRRRGETPFRSVTFRRGRHALPPQPFPVYVDGRSAFERLRADAGFRTVGVWANGFEEFALARRLPADLFVRLGSGWAAAPGFPQRFVLLERDDRAPSDAKLPAEFLACPRCGFDLPGAPSEAPMGCGRCGWTGTRAGGVLDLRYVP